MNEQPQQEQQGQFSSNFKGLDLGMSGKNANPAYASVFHNCDVSPDGSVVRRGGSRSLGVLDLNDTSGFLRVESIKTRGGSEYLIYINRGGFTVALTQDRSDLVQPVTIAAIAKAGVWTTTPTAITAITLTAPYDRMLFLTPEHPPVQLSFIERTLDLTCTANNGVGVFTLTAPTSANDSTLWNDTNTSSYIVTNSDGVVVPVTLKQTGFTFRLSGIFVVGQVYRLTVRQVSWQWWAESTYNEGGDVIQATSRFNVTDVDQSVKVPPRLITDLEPPYKNTQFFGLYAFSTGVWASNTYAGPSQSPTTENEYGFSNGARFTSANGNKLQVAPFFATFGARQAGGGISQVVFLRYRSLRFNGNTGAKPNDLQLFADNVQYPWSSVFPTPSGSFSTASESFTVDDRQLSFNSNAGDAAVTQRFWTIFNSPTVLSPSIPIHLTCLSASVYLTNSQRVWYRSLTNAGGNLDGTYVRAYGLGSFCDYSKRSFPKLGSLYRDRLILVNPNTSQDQVLVSELADTTVPGEFYQFFQIDDALTGAATDPFTLNVSVDSRERITALLGWQTNLFVFTNTNTYALAGGDNFSEANYNTNLVSTYGAFNQQCVVQSNLTVLFMNRFGVFDIVNKEDANTFGAVERSSVVRPLFDNSVVAEAYDEIHWMKYNESTSKLYCGVGVDGDTRTVSRVLMLNMVWGSWSTLSSALPFKLYPATQVFRYTLFTASLDYPRYCTMLCMDMPYHMDYSTTVGGGYPQLVSLPPFTQSYRTDSRNIVRLPVPTTPGLRDYEGDGSTKVIDRLVRNDSGFTTTSVQARNPMVDFPDTLALCGGNTTGTMVAAVSTYGVTGEAYAIYPNVTLNGLASTINGADGFTVKPVPPSVSLVGVVYHSVYASGTFDLDMGGRLKRLRRLHLTFDTTVTESINYPGYPSARPVNAAFTMVVSNYRGQVGKPSVELVGDTTRLDAQQLNLPLEIAGVSQRSITLQGYGCDYQFYVSSVGVEPFKLTSYEFEVQPQQYKRYTRR